MWVGLLFTKIHLIYNCSVKIQKNQKVFISFAYTGQDKKLVESRIGKLYQILKGAGLDPYCNLYDRNCDGFSEPGQFVKAAIDEIEKYDALLAVVASEHRSQGQLMEIGAALALGKPVYTLMHASAKSTGYIEDPHISNEVAYWETEEDLTAVVAGITHTESVV